MDKDFEIVVENEESDKTGNVQLPLNFLSFGEIENDDVKVYIKQDVYKALEKYASSDTTKELGTILIGDYCEQMGKTHVVISNYIEAKYTDASASTLTFTHETWDYVHKQHDLLYPTKKIVGWQHTHPNYGIFLSNYDLFIQENFFNLPFQIAYVIDPIQNIRGFFQWKNGKIEKLKGYYVYDEVGKPIKIEQTKPKSEIAKSSPKATKFLYTVLALLCVSTIALFITTMSLNQKYNQQVKRQETIMDEVNEQNELIDTQNDTIAKLQEQLVKGVLDSSGKTTAAELITMLENHEITLQNQEQLLKDLKDFVDKENTEGSNIHFKSYTVVSGDTLSKICNENSVDYNANKKIILSINGIDNPNQIYIGQVILLPISD